MMLLPENNESLTARNLFLIKYQLLDSLSKETATGASGQDVSSNNYKI